MTGAAPVADRPADEARLAQRAAAGDGDAFAELYGRYEKRAYNLCYRILGSEDDAADATQEAFVRVLRRLPKLEGRDLAFGSYLFTSARHACYDLIDRRRRAQPSDEIPESSVPVGGGVGGGGAGFDPGDPEDDPERNVLLAARQDEIRAANATLPPRQREVLALRELEELSYDEIAEIMDMNRNSVAQLISRARISLRDALRGTAVAAIATASADCERAARLLAATQDRQEAGGSDWLAGHLQDCQTCRLSREAMEEAGVSYRAWLPIAVAPALFRETMASAAEAVGVDWSDVTARHEAGAAGATGAGGAAGAGAATAGAAGARTGRLWALRHRRISLALIGVLALILVVVVFAGGTSDDTPPENAVSASDEVPRTPADEPAEPGKPRKTQKGADKSTPPAAAADPRSEGRGQREQNDEDAGDGPADDGGSGPSGSSGDKPGEASGSRTTGNGPRRQPGRDGGGRRPRGGAGETVAGGPAEPETPTPPPPPPPTEEPPPPPPETPPEPPAEPPPQPPDDPPPSAPGCRDSAGNPIPCPPGVTQPPPRRTTPPRGTQPPR